MSLLLTCLKFEEIYFQLCHLLLTLKKFEVNDHMQSDYRSCPFSTAAQHKELQPPASPTLYLFPSASFSFNMYFFLPVNDL